MDLTDYYSTVGYLRAKGLDEAQAYTKAEEVMEAPNTLEECANQFITSIKENTP